MLPLPRKPPAPQTPPSASTTRALLLRWFDQAKRDLPWRNTKDPYAIWLSEVMLQQTQVATVIPYWLSFLEAFPTLTVLAHASLDQVLAQWKGLGYYSRARNLHRAAQEVAARHGGVLPSTAAQLQELPGFGPYTAGAVASIAFGEAVPLVDGNVARVLSRLHEVEGLSGQRAREARLWSLAGALVLGERPGDLNQALMELGALVCRVDQPSCSSCPVRAQCLALSRKRVEELPERKVRKARKVVRWAVAVWHRKGALLLGRRAEKGLFGGLWELPSTALSSSSDDAAARLRALLGEDLQTGPALKTVKRTLTHRELHLQLHPVNGRKPPRRADGYEELRWVLPSELPTLGISTAMQKALGHALAASGE